MESSLSEGREFPLKGYITEQQVKSWHELALSNRSTFEAALQISGLADNQIVDALRVRDSAVDEITKIKVEQSQAEAEGPPGELANYVFEARKRAAAERLIDWMAGRKAQVEECVNVAFRIPLFILSAAPVKGCNASFITTSRLDRKTTWLVSILGAGLGGSTLIGVTAATTFTAASSERKLIFLPVSGIVEKITWLRRGQLVGRGHRIDAAKLTPDGAPGLLLLAEQVQLPAGEIAQRFPLAGDTTEAIATYEYSYERSRSASLKVGVNAFGIDFSLGTEVERVTDVTLNYQLRGGFDYELRKISDADGLVWEKPTGRVYYRPPEVSF